MEVHSLPKITLDLKLPRHEDGYGRGREIGFLGIKLYMIRG